MTAISFLVTNDLRYDQRMIRICSTLASEGYDVTLIGRQLPASLPLPERAFKQVRLECRYHKGKLFYLEYNWRLYRWLRQQKQMDIIGAVDLDTILPAVLIGKKRTIPVVYDAHEYFTEVPEVTNRPLIKWIWERIARWSIPKTAARYTVGPALAALMEKQYRLPFEIIRNMPARLDTNWMRPGQPPGKPVIILYQGALNEGRGLETVIAAMAFLPDAQLWLAGEGDLSHALRKQAAESDWASRIQFLGMVPPEQLPALTRKADIGLNLLEARGLSYYYSLANKAFDYVQAGVPAIHMDFPEYRKLLELHPIGVLLPELSVDQLVGVVRRVLDHYEPYRQACLAAREQWIWETESRQLLQIYKQVLPE